MSAALVGISFGVVLWLCGMWATAGGHGTYLAFAAFGAPLSLFGDATALLASPILWGVVGLAASFKEQAGGRIVLQALLLTHYASAVAIVAGFSGASAHDYEFMVNPHALIFTGPGLAAYAWGQWVIWHDVVREARSAA